MKLVTVGGYKVPYDDAVRYVFMAPPKFQGYAGFGCGDDVLCTDLYALLKPVVARWFDRWFQVPSEAKLRLLWEMFSPEASAAMAERFGGVRLFGIDYPLEPYAEEVIGARRVLGKPVQAYRSSPVVGLGFMIPGLRGGRSVSYAFRVVSRLFSDPRVAMDAMAVYYGDGGVA